MDGRYSTTTLLKQKGHMCAFRENIFILESLSGSRNRLHVQNKESVHLSLALVPEVGNLKYRALRESVHLGRVHLERVNCINIVKSVCLIQ